MSKINIGSQISGQSTFITNGITIRSNSNLNINQNIDQNTFKSIDTELVITVNDALITSAIGDIKVKSDDGVSDLITISGAKIDSVDIPGVDEQPETYGYSFKSTDLGGNNLIEINATSASVQKGIGQTTIKN